MSDEIKKQEEVILEALRAMERTAKEAEATLREWEILRDREQQQFEAWRIEHRLLRKMKEEQNEND